MDGDLTGDVHLKRQQFVESKQVSDGKALLVTAGLFALPLLPLLAFPLALAMTARSKQGKGEG